MCVNNILFLGKKMKRSFEYEDEVNQNVLTICNSHNIPYLLIPIDALTTNQFNNAVSMLWFGRENGTH